MHNPLTCLFWRMFIFLTLLLCALPRFAEEKPADAPRYISHTAATRARVPELVKQLSSPDANVRDRAVTELCYLDDDRAAEGFLAILADKTADSREDAARGLLRLGDARFIAPLFDALRNDDDMTRKMLAESMQNLRTAQALEPLLSESRAADAASRSVAAQMLGHIHQPQSADRLAEMMHGDTDAGVRRAGLLGLGNLGDTRALPGLRELLTSRDVNERVQAASALGLIHDRAAASALIPLLIDDESTVRLAAIKALNELADPIAIEALIAHLDTSDVTERRQLIYALVGIDLQALPALTVAVNANPSPIVRVGALTAMLEINHPCIADTLLAALSDPDLRVCNAAILGLARFKDKRAVQPLLALLRQTVKGKATVDAETYRQLADSGNVDYDEREKRYPDGPPIDIITVRLSAIRTLGIFQDLQVIPIMLPLALSDEERIRIATNAALPHGEALTRAVLPKLTSGTPAQRLRALDLLASGCDSIAIPALQTILRKEHNAEIRRAAVEVLAVTGDERVRQILIDLVNDPDPDVQETAVSGLAAYPSPETAKVLEKYKTSHNNDAALFWLEYGKRSAGNADTVPWLTEQLATCKSYMYDSIVGLLCDNASEAATDAIIASLQQRDFKNDEWIRQQAFERLGKVSSPKIAAALAREMHNPNVFTRLACARGLERLADPATADALIYALGDQSSEIRCSAARTLGRMHATQAQDALLGVLQDDPDARYAAAEAFGMLPDPRALPILLRMGATEALVAYDSPEIRTELREIAQNSAAWGWSRAEGLRALLQLGDTESLPLFRRALQDRDPLVKGWAAVALARMSTEDVHPQLQQVERYVTTELTPNSRNDGLAELDNEIHAVLGDPAIHNRHYVR